MFSPKSFWLEILFTNTPNNLLANSVPKIWRGFAFELSRVAFVLDTRLCALLSRFLLCFRAFAFAYLCETSEIFGSLVSEFRLARFKNEQFLQILFPKRASSTKFGFWLVRLGFCEPLRLTLGFARGFARLLSFRTFGFVFAPSFARDFSPFAPRCRGENGFF